MTGMDDVFPRYEQFEPLVPVWCVTPGQGRVIHRFFDTSPFSPSGRYMALFRLPFEDRLPRPGDAGEVLLVDLQTGRERVLDRTRGWESQLGANVQWGTSDEELFYNDVDSHSWRPYAVRLDPLSGRKSRLAGTVYKLSPDGKKAISANMAAMRRTQAGYGVVVPDDRVPRNNGIADDDGLYVTDTETGQTTLLVSIRQLIERAVPKLDLREYAGGDFYGFHCKYNLQGTRLMFTLRWIPRDFAGQFDTIAKVPLKYDVFTMRPDGSELYDAIPACQWDKGGHHTTWFPDGERLSMNLNIERKGMCFVKVNYDGTGLEKIIDGIPGSGHPTVHPDGRHIVTDAYPGEPVAFADGTIPIRLIDLESRRQTTLVRIRTRTGEQDTHPALRVDSHPAWDPKWRRIAFNGFADGTRRVYVADLSRVLDA